ncbi:hypothetical protein [Aurantibacter sp.]|uniref:hypothetical protein n=1 Tax=Aurantibacter sp. TaxID=2807103 RepID=UPI00326336AE
MKTIKMALLGLVLIASYNCKEIKKEAKEDLEAIEAVASEQFSLVQDSTKVSFTAYKTSEKLPVGGTFTEINFTNSNSGATALEALNGTEFSIPVSSLFTNDATGTRDPKLLEFFFGVMENTTLISGVFKVSADEKSSIDVTLNGKTGNIPLEVEKTSDDRYTFKGVMELEKWDALDAVASINKACEALHTGKDGVSKTWSDVAVQAEVLLQKK